MYSIVDYRKYVRGRTMPVQRYAVYLLFFMVTVTGLAHAQATPPVEEWNISFGGPYPGDNYDVGYFLQETDENTYVIVGEMGRTPGTSAVWLIQIDPSGNKIRDAVFGTPGTTDERGYSVAQTGDGGFVLCGNTRYVTIPGTDAMVLKTDKNGGKLWEKTYNKGALGTTNNAFSIKTTTDGGFILAGMVGKDIVGTIGTTTTAGTVGKNIAWVAKLDSAGNILWEKVILTAFKASDIVQTGDGGYLVVGIRNDGYYFVEKLDDSGNYRWDQRLNHKYSSASFNDATLIQTDDNFYLMYVNSATNRNIPYLVKMNDRGDILWQQQVGTDPKYNPATRFAQTRDRGFVLLYDGRKIIKTDVNGTTEWVFNKSYGEPYAVQETGDGGFILAGKSSRSGVTNLWVSKLSGERIQAPRVPSAHEATTARTPVSAPIPTPAVTTTVVEPVPSQTASPQAASPQESPARKSPVSMLTIMIAFSLLIGIPKLKTR